jgi:hypothetical protein
VSLAVSAGFSPPYVRDKTEGRALARCRSTPHHYSIDYAGCLEADPMIGPRKFAGDLNVQADRPRHAEHSQIAGHPRKVLIAFLDACRNKAHARKIRDVEKDLAAQILIEARGVCVHGSCRDPKVDPAPGRSIKVDLDAAVEGFELAVGSRPADRVDPKAHMSLGRVDFPGRSRS